MIDYNCKKCEHKFSSNDEIPYCTACGCEDLNEDDSDENKQ